MNCPSCNSSLEPNARFCGVCGYRLQASRPASGASPQRPGGGGGPAPMRQNTPSGGAPRQQNNIQLGPAGAQASLPRQPATPKPIKPKVTKGDEIYLNQ